MKKKLQHKKKPDFINGLGDSGRATADMAVVAVDNDAELFREVIELSFSQPYPINMRTARLAQLCCEKNPSLILPHLNEVIEKISISNNDGVKRSYLKVINDYTGIESIEDPGFLVQTCFDWLMSPRTAIAVRYHCMGILMKVSNKIPELKPELQSVIEFMIEGEELSPGLKSACKKSNLLLLKKKC
jgi:hypothetical protein